MEKFDDIDLKIFEILYDTNKFLTTTEIARTLFIIKDVSDLRVKDSIVRFRLRKWERKLIIKSMKGTKSDNSGTRYGIVEDNLSIHDTTFNIDKKNYPIRLVMMKIDGQAVIIGVSQIQ